MSTPEVPPTPPTPPGPPMPPAMPPYGYPQYGPPAPTDGLAVAALVTGIVGVTMICAYGIGLVPAIVAIVLGRKSMKKIDASQGQLGGRGLAQAGYILGVVATAIIVLLIVLVAGLFGAMFATDCFGDGC